MLRVSYASSYSAKYVTKEISVGSRRMLHLSSNNGRETEEGDKTLGREISGLRWYWARKGRWERGDEVGFEEKEEALKELVNGR